MRQNAQPSTPAPFVSRLVDYHELRQRIPVDRATLWRWRKAGRFPEPLKIPGSTRTLWRESDVQRFIDGKTS